MKLNETTNRSEPGEAWKRSAVREERVRSIGHFAGMIIAACLAVMALSLAVIVVVATFRYITK